MSEKLIEVKDLVVKFHTDEEIVHAVNGVSLSLNKGETLGLVGETGAGKTTTALSILRLLPQRVGKIENGSILFDGEELLEFSDEKMRATRGGRISMIFQDPMTSLNPVLRVGEQIAENLRLHNESKRTKEQIEERVEEILLLVGIPANRKTDYPHQFSGGMKQRVMIAIALACDPEMLIADEPTTALDVTIQAQVLAMMYELKEKLQTAMILITHDLGVVAETCDNVAIMYAGEIIEYGSVEAVYNAEKHHPYTVGLFNAIPSMSEDSDRLHPIPGLMPDPTDLPKGCKFSPRCPHVMDICHNECPKEYNENGHIITCHLYK